MRHLDVFAAWGRILGGYTPFLSIEITKECPLRCPGCYAYEPAHLNGAGGLRQLHDLKGDALVAGVLDVVKQVRPIHISIVGGEPLVRYRELDVLLPELARMGIEVQLVTSAVRPIPQSWAAIPGLHLTVSVDGLPPEHDVRRAPATYDRLLQHINGHRVAVHCTVTAPMARRPGYLTEFAEFWAPRQEAHNIWFSLYTPQEGDSSEERLNPADRLTAIHEIVAARRVSKKVHMPDITLKGYLDPPRSPEECVFSRVTTCVSADLKTRITPCQFGGHPVCAECGCIASAGLASFARYRIAGLLPVSSIFSVSHGIGQRRAAGRAA